MRFIYFIFLLFNCTIGYSQQYLSKEKAIEDIDFMNKVVEEVHFNPFLFIEKKNYYADVEKIKNQLNDSISTTEFILKLYYLTALFRDGHCTPHLVQPALKTELLKEQFFPYAMVIDNDNMYISASTAIASGLPKGAIIKSINKVPISPLMADMKHYFGGNESYSMEMRTKLLSYLLFLNNIKPPFQLIYENGNGRKTEITIPSGINFKEALILTLPHIKTKFNFKIIDQKLGYLDFMTMSGDINVFDRYVDSCITVLKEKNINNLAIDLRKNSGGNSEFGDLLISYFNTGKYALMGERKWKISGLYKEYLKAKGDSSSEYLSKKEGTIWQLGNCQPEEPRFKNNNIFTGNVYVITGAFTFSSANMLADGVKQYKLAQTIGQPTGENTNDFGEAYVFNLPNSNIKMQTTTSFDIGANCNQRDYTPVVPNILIKEKLKDKINEDDKVIQYILKHIK